MSETGSVDGWNGDEAQHWVTEADRYDGQLAPFGDLLVDRLQLAANETVLDVGCGCGATTIGAARPRPQLSGLICPYRCSPSERSVPMSPVCPTSSSSSVTPLTINSQRKGSTRSSVDSV